MKDAKVQFEETTACDRCGRFGVFVFEGEKLCAECYEVRGACCAEFGGEDRTDCEDAPDKGETADQTFSQVRNPRPL